MFKRTKRQITGWMTIAAMLWSALAPSAAHALASWNGTPGDWQQICSAQGGKAASVAGAPQLPATGDTAQLEHHCPCCLLHQAHGAPPAPIEPVTAAPEGRLFAPDSEVSASRGRPFWMAPPSRAPPALI